MVKNVFGTVYSAVSGGIMVSKLDQQTIMSEFKSHWVPHLYGFVPHRSKKLSKLREST